MVELVVVRKPEAAFELMRTHIDNSLTATALATEAGTAALIKATLRTMRHTPGRLCNNGPTRRLLCVPFDQSQPVSRGDGGASVYRGRYVTSGAG